MSVCTVRLIYLRFKEQGVLTDRRKTNAGRPLADKTKIITQLVTQQRYLQDWQTLTLYERCE